MIVVDRGVTLLCAAGCLSGTDFATFAVPPAPPWRAPGRKQATGHESGDLPARFPRAAQHRQAVEDPHPDEVRA